MFSITEKVYQIIAASLFVVCAVLGISLGIERSKYHHEQAKTKDLTMQVATWQSYSKAQSDAVDAAAQKSTDVQAQLNAALAASSTVKTKTVTLWRTVRSNQATTCEQAMDTVNQVLKGTK